MHLFLELSRVTQYRTWYDRFQFL